MRFPVVVILFASNSTILEFPEAACLLRANEINKALLFLGSKGKEVEPQVCTQKIGTGKLKPTIGTIQVETFASVICIRLLWPKLSNLLDQLQFALARTILTLYVHGPRGKRGESWEKEDSIGKEEEQKAAGRGKPRALTSLCLYLQSLLLAQLSSLLSIGVCVCVVKVEVGVVKILPVPGGSPPVFPTAQQLLLLPACSGREQGGGERG